MRCDVACRLGGVVRFVAPIIQPVTSAYGERLAMKTQSHSHDDKGKLFCLCIDYLACRCLGDCVFVLLGRRGETGATGASGVEGESKEGPEGLQGEPGDRGFMDSMIGFKGFKGVNGVAGETGELLLIFPIIII